MGAADASDLITVVHCDEHDLFRRGLADMLSTVDDKQIATSLHLSEAALKRHLANTYGKIEIGSLTEATQKARVNGWISPFEFSEGYENDREGQHGQ